MVSNIIKRHKASYDCHGLWCDQFPYQIICSFEAGIVRSHINACFSCANCIDLRAPVHNQSLQDQPSVDETGLLVHGNIVAISCTIIL